MADLVRSATATAAALEQCIDLFCRFREAHKRHKGLPELADKYSVEVSRTKTIVELTRSEPALRTPNVDDTITKLADISKDLSSHLELMTKTRHLIRGLIKQFASGKDEQEKLDSLMRDLGYAKQDLGMYIQLANVGLTRAAGETVQVNTTAVDAVNKLLTEKLGSTYSLKIAQLVEGRPRNADETVTLTEDDIVTLSKQQASMIPKKDHIPPRMTDQTSRIIRENEAADLALQVNTPIGVDVWKDIGSVTVEKNKASGSANQWNYPMESVDAFLAALERRKPAGSS